MTNTKKQSELEKEFWLAWGEAPKGSLKHRKGLEILNFIKAQIQKAKEEVIEEIRHNEPSNVWYFQKSTLDSDTKSFFDYSDEEKKEIVTNAAKKSNKMQKELMDKVGSDQEEFWNLCEDCGDKLYPNANKKAWKAITVMVDQTCPNCKEPGVVLIPIADWEGHGD